MKSRESYIHDICHHVFHYNEYWEDPVTDSDLINNTTETCELIKSYCNMIKANKKGIFHGNFEKHSNVIKEAIKEIIYLTSDGRPLWIASEYYNYKRDERSNNLEPRTYDHHVNMNGHLEFENNPQNHVDRIIELIDELLILEDASNHLSKKLNKYLNKPYFFNGYESGSYIISFYKIYRKNSEFYFDGEVIKTLTPNNSQGDGIVIYTAENENMDILPYYGEVNNEEELIKFIENAPKFNKKDIKEHIKWTINCYLEDLFETKI